MPPVRHLAVWSFAAFILAMGVACAAADPEGQRSESGLRAVEDHWTAAYFRGDTAWLQSMLDDSYQSVGAHGAKDKAAIVESARAFAAANRGATPPTLPPTSKIEIRGDTAVVTHLNPTDRSVDVFYWQAGRWRGLYSQHTPRTDAAS
jgi:hypothetical protein